MVDETGMPKILRALKDKERNRPPFRKNNGQSLYKNYNRSSRGNGSQFLYRNNNQRSAKGPKIPSVYKTFRIYSENDNCKDTDSQHFSKASNNQQFSEGLDNQRFSENPPETDVPLKSVMMDKKVNDFQYTEREKKENVANKFVGGSGTMNFTSQKAIKEHGKSLVTMDLDRTKDAFFDKDDEDVLPTMEEVEQFLCEQANNVLIQLP
uniref:Uncharacterized protein n=1 Tax=Strongyloides papillosus TaxID=174720 RepID=A0A0N5C5I4_STREA